MKQDILDKISLHHMIIGIIFGHQLLIMNLFTILIKLKQIMLIVEIYFKIIFIYFN
jgi:hypothetical protein